MGVLLTNSYENDRLASGVYHIQSSADLLIDSIKLGHDNTVNALRVDGALGRIQQSLVELSELVYGVISDESFTNE